MIDSKHKNILIIGGSGFIGSHLIDYYHKHMSFNKIVVVDTVSSLFVRELEYLNDKIEFKFLDNFDDDISKLLNLDYFDSIYYLAASVGVKKTVTDPSNVIDNNLIPLMNLVKKINPSIDFLFTSSSEVYGNSSNFNEDNEIVIPSSNLRWSYACSKAMGEFIVRSNLNNSRIVRLFNIVGPRQYFSTGMVLPSFIYNAVLNKNIKVYNGGNQIRSFCYVEDCVKSMINIINSNKSINDIINIGNDKNITTIMNLAIDIINKFKSNSKIIMMNGANDFNIFSKNYGDVENRIPNITKLKTYINTSNFKSLDDIIDIIINSGEY